MTINSREGEKIARNESLFREVNERIAESAERFAADSTKFVCECADAACTERVDATLDEYERVRGDGATFLVVNGHEDERAEVVVFADGDRAVVEKQHPLVAPLARQLDPRAARSRSRAGLGARSPDSRGSAARGGAPRHRP